jgi:TolB protein
MRTRVRSGLAAIGRALLRLVRLVLAAPLRIVQFAIRLPVLLWRLIKAIARFLVELPGRIVRGIRAAVRFVSSLPGRAWLWVKSAAHRIRLRILEWRARLYHWWRTKVFPPRTISPKTQRLAILSTLITLAILVYLSAQVSMLSRAAPTVIVATPTADPSSRPIPSRTPTPAHVASMSATLADSGADFGGGGAVAFALRRNGNTDIYVRKLADDQLLRMTYHSEEDRQPAWAPDGETMAMVSRRGGNWDIYRLDLISGALIRLTRNSEYDGHPSWSPDGAFIAFESYRDGNLDIFIMRADGSEVHQLTSNDAADFAPAWSPDGRHIAFVSQRDGSKDIFLYPLDEGTEDAVINLTQTPDRDEDGPAWSPDGSRLAFSVGRFGTQMIYITTFDWNSRYLDEAQTQLFNPGSRPDWSPDGSSLIYEYQRAGRNHLIADSVSGWGAGREVFSASESVSNPSWSTFTVDPEILATERENAPMGSASVYIEEILPTPESGPPYTIVSLNDVNGGDAREFLSDRVNDSFEALRQQVFEQTGTDYLAALGDSFRAINVIPPPGQSPRSWHKAGRAFDLNQGLYERDEPLVQLVREDIGFRTYWRVYLRATNQDGSQGEPLHDAPWDLKARQAGGLAAREGGELSQEIPPGYYVDFTELAADYGWERVPANNRWRQLWEDTNWWQFRKTHGMTWFDAMLELYRSDQIEAVFGPVAQETP